MRKASHDTPATRNPSVTAMMTSTRRALSPSGLRKLLTPLEIASSPVSDDPPLAKDPNNVSTTTPATSPDPPPTGTAPGNVAGSYCGRVPSRPRMTPTTITAAIATVNR